jgi:hypothetical protein
MISLTEYIPRSLANQLCSKSEDQRQILIERYLGDAMQSCSDAKLALDMNRLEQASKHLAAAMVIRDDIASAHENQQQEDLACALEQVNRDIEETDAHICLACALEQVNRDIEETDAHIKYAVKQRDIADELWNLPSSDFIGGAPAAGAQMSPAQISYLVLKVLEVLKSDN